METNSIFRRFVEYHLRKWYPAKYEDPYGEFVDDLSEETIRGLSSDPHPASAALALILLELLPRRRFPDLLKDAERAYTLILEGGVRPGTTLYYLRSLPALDRAKLWESWKHWARQTKTQLLQWATERAALAARLAKERRDALARFGIDETKECAELEALLRTSRDLFDFELRRFESCQTLADCLAAFRMPISDALADWNDFASFAAGWADTCHISLLPALQRSVEEPAEQQAFPIDPPRRVIVRYGTAAGPADTLRFLQELGRTSFYCGMNPELEPSERLLGDPRLPHFWASLYAGTLTHPAGISKLVRTGSQDLAARFNLILQFWNRYDCLLAVYQERLAPDLKEAQDLYVACWESSFALQPPHFLYLYDLERSRDAIFRSTGSRSAFAATERLRSLYGYDWFASERCARRLREYQYEGYRLQLNTILQDLDAGNGENFLIPSS